MSTWRECENGSRIATCYHVPRCAPMRPGQPAGERPFGRYVESERTCRTPEEALAAGQADAADDPPLDQDQADEVAVILAPNQAADAA